MNAKFKPVSSSAGALFCAMALLAGGTVSSGCSKKAEDKPAGLAPLPNASAPPAAPSAPAAAPSAPAPGPSAAEAAAEAPAPSGPPIEGVIELAPERKKDVAPGDPIFLVARTVSDTPGIRGSLVAVKRFTAAKFPITFSLGPQDMMFQGTSFSGELALSARVDKDSDPITRKKGDVFGVVDRVKVGAKGVKVVLRELQKEDESLTGPAATSPHGGMPPHGGGMPHPGAPAGHPPGGPAGHPPGLPAALPAGHP